MSRQKTKTSPRGKFCHYHKRRKYLSNKKRQLHHFNQNWRAGRTPLVASWFFQFFPFLLLVGSKGVGTKHQTTLFFHFFFCRTFIKCFSFLWLSNRTQQYHFLNCWKMNFHPKIIKINLSVLEIQFMKTFIN